MRRNTKTMYEWRKAYSISICQKRGVYTWQGKGEKTSPFLRGQKCAINCIDNISPL